MENQNYGKNFMTKFTNKNSDALRHLTSKQFFEVWSNYDQDGESSRLVVSTRPKSWRINNLS